MKIFNRFKRKNTPEFNLNHPELRDKIEFAFKSGGVKYYQFREDFEIPTGRYKFILAFLEEHNLRMTTETLQKYIDELTSALDGSQGQINLGSAFITIEKMRGRANLAFIPDTIKRLASVIYFDESENLSDFKYEYGIKKVMQWEKNETLDFFLMRPIQGLLGLKSSSESILMSYIQKVSMMADLIYDTQPQSSEGT